MLEPERKKAGALFPDLERAWERLPGTLCDRRCACCALLPQMTLVEACRILETVETFPQETRTALGRRLIRYFMLNAARISTCPFLDQGGCLVYPVRPFGCRAYGLWSPAAYKRQAEAAVQAQKNVARAWQGLGVKLPKAVVRHKVPYCRQVIVPNLDLAIADQGLKDAAREIQSLDQYLGAEAQVFTRVFFNDLAFLTSGQALGADNALRAKVQAVREHLAHGSSTSLDILIEKKLDQGKMPF